MFMLAHARAFPAALLNESGQAMAARDHSPRELLAQRRAVLIVGFGAIGERLAELLSPLTKNIRAVRRRVRGDETIETRPIEALVEMLPHAKHVINTLPDNPTTRGLFDRLAFSRMSKGAIYNVGRGSTVDQDALIGALQSGALGAAYLDVCTPEPLPPDHPLLVCAQLSCHPHSAGGHAG